MRWAGVWGECVKSSLGIISVPSAMPEPTRAAVSANHGANGTYPGLMAPLVTAPDWRPDCPQPALGSAIQSGWPERVPSRRRHGLSLSITDQCSLSLGLGKVVESREDGHQEGRHTGHTNSVEAGRQPIACSCRSLPQGAEPSAPGHGNYR